MALSFDEFLDMLGASSDGGTNAIKPAQKTNTTTARRYKPALQRVLEGNAGITDYADAALDLATQFMPSAIKSFSDGKGTTEDVAKRLAENTTQGQTASRLRQNAGAGIAAIPSQVAGAVDLARLGVPAVVEGALSDDDAAITSRIADAFMARVLPDDAKQRLTDLQVEALTRYGNKFPNASDDERRKFMEDFASSDVFNNAVMNELPMGLRIANQGQTAANKLSGLNLRADEMSPGDEAVQILAGAGIGLTPEAFSRLSRPVANAVGKRVMNNVGTKVGLRAIEAVTPITLPLTPGNFALNAGLGVGINEAMRGMQGVETLLPYENLYDPDKLPPPETLGAATGLSLAAIFGAPGVLRGVERSVAEQATKGVEEFAARSGRIGQNAGPTLEKQSTDSMERQLNPLTGLIDQNAPVKSAAQKFKATDDIDTVPDLDATMSSVSPTNITENMNNALNYGIFDNLGRDGVAFADIDKAYNQLKPVEQDLLDKYVYATMRDQDGKIYGQTLAKQYQEATAREGIAQQFGNNAEKKAAAQQRVELYNKLEAFKADTPLTREDGTEYYPSRSSMVDWSRNDVQGILQLAEQNPKIKQLGDAMRKLNSDLIDYQHANGVIDAATAAQWKQERSLHVRLQERKYADKSGLQRTALLYRDKIRPREGDSTGVFVNSASRDITGEGATVNNPKTAITSLQETVLDAVRSVAANGARREVVDRLAALPNAKGTLLKPYEFNLGNGRTTTSVSEKQLNALFPKGIKNEDDYIKIFRDGKVEFWKFSDPSITKSLQFAPAATVPVLNSMRKTWQTMTTGLLAPWFAAKNFLWDAPLAQTTKNAGRSLGMVDTLARRLVDGTALERPVGATLDRVFDPTVFASAGVAIPYQLGLRAARAVGEKVADDLARNSGMFAAMHRVAPEFTKGIGTYMATKFDESVLAVMSRNMSTSISHLNDMASMRDDFAKAASRFNGPLGTAINGYKAMLESIHMSTRTAFFWSNYSRLEAKFGKGKVPQNEVKRLVQETRNLTGDMSRQSNNAYVQRMAAVIPYANATIQGTRHVLSAAIPKEVAQAVNLAGGNMLTDRNSRFWSQIMTGVIIPKIAMAGMLSNWEGADDYWYNKTPKWKQATSIPIPSIDAIQYYFENGEYPPFDPKYLNVLPLAPELSLISEPVMGALRGMGVIGQKNMSTPQPMSGAVKDVIDQLTSFATPPAIQALAATQGQRFDLHGLITGGQAFSPINNQAGGGANADKLTYNSAIPQRVYDVISALAGSSAQIAMQTLNVAELAASKEDNIFDAATSALSAAGDTLGFELKRRLPEIDVPVLFDARQRQYAFTPESEYVYKTEKALDPIIGTGRQLSVEKDSKGALEAMEQMGLDKPGLIKDPMLKGVSQAIWDTLKKKGEYKAAKEAYTDTRKQLAALEASRYRIPDDKYNQVRNQMIQKQQELRAIQARVLQETERQLQKQLGRRFIQQYGVPFSYENLSDLVRKSVAQ